MTWWENNWIKDNEGLKNSSVTMGPYFKWRHEIDKKIFTKHSESLGFAFLLFNLLNLNDLPSPIYVSSCRNCLPFISPPLPLPKQNFNSTFWSPLWVSGATNIQKDWSVYCPYWMCFVQWLVDYRAHLQLFRIYTYRNADYKVSSACLDGMRWHSLAVRVHVNNSITEATECLRHIPFLVSHAT